MPHIGGVVETEQILVQWLVGGYLPLPVSCLPRGEEEGARIPDSPRVLDFLSVHLSSASAAPSRDSSWVPACLRLLGDSSLRLRGSAMGARGPYTVTRGSWS